MSGATPTRGAQLVRPPSVPLWQVVAVRDPDSGRVRVGHWEPVIPAYNRYNDPPLDDAEQPP